MLPRLMLMNYCNRRHDIQTTAHGKFVLLFMNKVLMKWFLENPLKTDNIIFFFTLIYKFISHTILVKVRNFFMNIG